MMTVEAGARGQPCSYIGNTGSRKLWARFRVQGDLQRLTLMVSVLWAHPKSSVSSKAAVDQGSKHMIL